jgi:hypothetical protein
MERSRAFQAQNTKTIPYHSLPQFTLNSTAALIGVFALECCANVLIDELGEGKSFDDVDKLPVISKLEMCVTQNRDWSRSRSRRKWENCVITSHSRPYR